jgi:hypothetical protein
MSIVESESRIDVNILAIVRKLLALSSVIPEEYVILAVEALVQMGGPSMYEFMCETVEQMFTLALQSLASGQVDDGERTLYLIGEIINSIPDDADILPELAAVSLPLCVSLLRHYGDDLPFDEVFRLIAFFNAKIDDPTDIMYETTAAVLESLSFDEVLINAVQSLAYLLCPIILSPAFAAHSDLVNSCIGTSRRLIEFLSSEGDYDGRAYALLVIGCLLLALGAPVLELFPVFFEGILDEDPAAAILFSASVFGIGAGMFAPGCDVRDVIAMIPGDVIPFMLRRISEGVLQTYKELRMGFLALVRFAEAGINGAYPALEELVPVLVDLRSEEMQTSDEKMASAGKLTSGGQCAAFPPLVIPFAIPQIDVIDELALVTSLAGRGSLVS